MSEVGSPSCTPDWLALREAADADARAAELVTPLAAYLQSGPVTILDLGCGTGAMGRWLAPRLPGPQRWTLHDRDAGLLARAVAAIPAAGADGSPIMARARVGDLTGLRAIDFAGTRLATASALLDLLTAQEVDALAAACAEAGCALLFTLTVSGRVCLDPVEPLDTEFAAAFDAHQRRVVGGRRLLGPDAGPAAAEALAIRDAAVTVRPGNWRLGPDRAALLEEWLRGWIGAACDQRPELARHARAYLRRRLAAIADGLLRAEVGHLDILALPTGR